MRTFILRKEIQEMQEVAITAMIDNTELSDKDIANALNVDVAIVAKIRAETV